MANVEVFEFASGGQVFQINLLDEAVHLLADRAHDLIHVVVGAFHDELDATVGKVFDVAVNVVALGDVLNGVAETNPLDASAKMTFPAMGGVRRMLEVSPRHLHGIYRRYAASPTKIFTSFIATAACNRETRSSRSTQQTRDRAEPVARSDSA